MEVYIDNQKTNFGRRTKDLEKILKAISKKLEKNNKVIENIYINGSSIEEFPFIDMDMKNVMEVTTKSYVDLSLESLNLSKEYIEIFFDINSGFQENIIEKEEISAIEIEETDVFLNWFSDLLYFLITKSNLLDNFIFETFSVFVGRCWFLFVVDVGFD